MAFNGQGQWKQAEWDAFKAWSTTQLSSVDKRLHLLRFKSAVTRRRLNHLLKSLPPNIDSNVKAASLAFKPEAFSGPWEPEKYGDKPLALVPTVAPKAVTGVESSGIKDTFNREIRAVEYYEHLIQKTRFEIQKIEDEIYWLECSGKKIPAHIATVDSQFKDPEFRENLLGKDTLLRHEFTDPIDPLIKQQFFDGSDLIAQNESAPPIQNQPTQFDHDYFKDEGGR